MSDGMLKKMGDMVKEAEEFRAMMESRYKDDDPIERVRKLLIDVLCLLHVEFYIRPRD